MASFHLRCWGQKSKWKCKWIAVTLGSVIAGFDCTTRESTQWTNNELTVHLAGIAPLIKILLPVFFFSQTTSALELHGNLIQSFFPLGAMTHLSVLFD